MRVAALMLAGTLVVPGSREPRRRPRIVGGKYPRHERCTRAPQPARTGRR